MSLDPKSVEARWESIRDNPDCDLSLAPASVASYLSTPESELVRERMMETLIQLADYRLDRRCFVTPGDLATCEGLESFLVPAAEQALPLGVFLDRYSSQNAKQAQSFIHAILADIGDLLGHWEKGEFSGKPYAKDKLLDAVDPVLRAKTKTLNITEAAAMACRVLTHLLTIKLSPSGPDASVPAFDHGLNEERLGVALANAVDFLVRSFQKAEGATEEEKIANASYGEAPGSGWSWTEWHGLPPMLFFTAAAVDAFAELDLYLIRPAREGVFEKGTPAQRKLGEIYNENRANLLRFQLCVEMARRWIQNAVLPYLSAGSGQYREAEIEPVDVDEFLKEFPELAREGFADAEKPPVLFYNNLYSLQVLLWSWADRSDSGETPNHAARSRIDRALVQLVYSYDAIPIVKKVLAQVRYRFYLPGATRSGFQGPSRKFLQEKSEKNRESLEYLDAGFLPLLTRLLILFVVYGVGDRNLLEPVIRDLYVELLQNRNRSSPESSALWSVDEVEVFATQRAIQALTFYYAYARGRELVSPGPPSQSSQHQTVVFKAPVGTSLVFEARLEGEATHIQPPLPPPPPPVQTIDAENFGEYCNSIAGFKMAIPQEGDETLMLPAHDLGNQLLAKVHSGAIQDVGAARLILNGLARLVQKPTEHKTLRTAELSMLEHQYRDLAGPEASAAGGKV